jgi:hypothetical protein
MRKKGCHRLYRNFVGHLFVIHYQFCNFARQLCNGVLQIEIEISTVRVRLQSRGQDREKEGRGRGGEELSNGATSVSFAMPVVCGLCLCVVASVSSYLCVCVFVSLRLCLWSF